MSSRQARIERVVRVRDERLKQAVMTLEQARIVERRLLADHSLALEARENAERARRALSVVPADIRDFIEAEDWLRSCSLVEEVAAHRVRQARSLVDKCQHRVKDAHTKVRQLEKLQERLQQEKRAKEHRVERAREDEVGQRIAQSQRGRR